MSESKNESLVRRPADSIEVAADRRGRILSNMVGDALALANPGFLLKTREDSASAAEALFQKGLGYFFGKGVPKDEVEAVKWWRKAAEQGHAFAQYNLGACYHDGVGVTADALETAKWCRKAAEQGHSEAQYQLGVLYNCGDGVRQDFTEAAKWYRLAAEQGHADAQWCLGVVFGDTFEETEKVEWIRKAAEQGHTEAQLVLGRRYEDGDGVPQNHTEAVKWYREAREPFREAAENGDAGAQFKFGELYGRSEGEPQADVEAAKWFRKAAEQGHVEACYSLGHCLAGTESVRWLRKAAEQNHQMAKVRLSMVFADGEGVTRDLVEAYKWLRLATDHNDFWTNKLNWLCSSYKVTEEQIAEAEKRCREFRSHSPLRAEQIVEEKRESRNFLPFKN